MNPELLADCVHCGFCLPTCPTYVLWHEEMDSPRGRIDLMSAVAAGSLPLSDTVVEHFDRCLGCMACVTACPSGVKYDVLIELTRARVEDEHRRSAGDALLRSLLLATLPHRRRLRTALALAPLGRALPVPRRLGPLVELAPPFRSAVRPPALTRPAGEPRARVGLLAGCVQSVVFGDVNAATTHALAADGYEVACPRRQGCCGALAVHAGHEHEGRRRARATIAAFERLDVDVVAVNAAGCGSAMKDYGRLLADDSSWAKPAAAFSAQVRDVSELLAEPHAPRRPLELRVALQDSCHLAHAQGLREEPRALLAAIPGLERLEPAEQEVCCGSAGIYNLVQPEAAGELGRRKARAVLGTKPDAYASANPGCLVQVTRYLRAAARPLPAFHPVELVDASIRGIPAAELLAGARW